MRDKKDSLEAAKEYAFLLLKFRLRSQQELVSRLKQKKFNDEIIDKLVHFLKEKQFLDDSLFTQAWVKTRLKRNLGFRRIRNELRIKGVAKEVIENRIDQAKKDYSESEVVQELARKKFEIFNKNGIDLAKSKARIYAYLIRRGFSTEIISDTISQL